MPDRSRRTFLAGVAGVAVVGASTAGAIIFNRTDDTASAQTPVGSSAASSAAQSSPVASSSDSVITAVITEPARVVATPTTSAASQSATTIQTTTATTTPGPSASNVSASKASTSKAASSTPAASPTAASTYKSGKYTQSGDYNSPGGSESITVTVTLVDDVVTATSATGSAADGPSSQYQEQFISGYAGEVVGKDVDSISLSRVSGSSLTSTGFNAALAKIKSEAKA